MEKVEKANVRLVFHTLEYLRRKLIFPGNLRGINTQGYAGPETRILQRSRMNSSDKINLKHFVYKKN